MGNAKHVHKVLTMKPKNLIALLAPRTRSMIKVPNNVYAQLTFHISITRYAWPVLKDRCGTKRLYNVYSVPSQPPFTKMGNVIPALKEIFMMISDSNVLIALPT